MDSELKEIYIIDHKLTWLEQREEIVTKLLPPLYRLVSMKYNNITNAELLKMLYNRWRSRHRVHNIKVQGEERIKINKRRTNKNSQMQQVSKHSIKMKWKI